MNNENNKGLDAWNDRLDHNLEPEEAADKRADLRAEEFSDLKGSGDQSDDPTSGKPDQSEYYEDNLAQSQPREQDPNEPLSREE